MGKLELAPVWAACVAADLFRKPDAGGSQSKPSDTVLHAIGQAYAGPFPCLSPFGHEVYFKINGMVLTESVFRSVGLICFVMFGHCWSFVDNCLVIVGSILGYF